MKPLRIAVCQIECHPALYFGYIAPLEEPFLTKIGTSSLSLLSTKGLDISALQQVCLREYIEWSKMRLSSIIKFFNTIKPTPDLVLFPEGSVPLPCLPILYEWSIVSGATVLAGTHTPRLGRSGHKYYDELSLSKSDIRKLHKQAKSNVLPLIRKDKTVLIPKRLESVFERTEVSPSDPSIPSLKSYSFEKDENRITLLPLICSEALKLHNLEGSHDLAAILAYDAKPDKFQNYIKQQVHNQSVVAFCNDGMYGGSFIYTAVDNRSPEWLYQALPTGLPKGDGILIADVDLDACAVQVGTANPNQPLKLVTLSSITYENSTQYNISAELQDISLIDEPGVRAVELQSLINQQRANNLQRIRLARLQQLDSRGVPSKDYWDSLCIDCRVKGLSRLVDLEKRLACTCQETINDILKTGIDSHPEVASNLIEFLGECVKRAGNKKEPFVLTPDIRTIIVNRESEVKRVLDAIDDQNLSILEIAGLEQIGKSSIIKKALAQSGITSIIHVKLTGTSSVEYILYSIIKQGGGDLNPPYNDPVNVAKSVHIINAMRSARVIYIESGHELLDFRVWRDDLIPKVLNEIINIASDLGVMILLESRTRLTFEMSNPTLKAYLGILGLYKHLLEHGVSLFEAQLRRNGLSARSVSDDDKKFIVDKLGGHPIAISLAANVVFEDGQTELLDTLRNKRGFYLNYVSKLVRGLNLSKDERQVLRLVALARGPVPRDVILSSADFSAGLVIRNLINCGALEIDNMGLIHLPGILRDYFSPKKLPSDQIHKFHENAASSFHFIAKKDYKNMWASVEAEYHAAISGITIDFDISFVDGALAAAKELYNRQNYDEARKIIQPLLEHRKTYDILRFYALVEARTNHLDNAIELAKEVFYQYPNDTWILSELTDIVITQYQADQVAEELISIARKAGIEDVSLLIIEGKLLRRQRRLQDAEKVFVRAAEISRKNPWPHYYVGQIYYQTGYLDEAIKVLKEGEEFCYEIDSRNKNAYNAIRTLLGVVYLFNGQIDLAEPIIESLFEEEPSRPEIARAYAALTIQRDGIKKAHIALERLSKASEGSMGYSIERCHFHILMGLFYEGIENKYQAAEEFEKAHNCDRSNVFVMMKLSSAHFDIGEFLWKDQNESYKYYLNNCAIYVRKILKFDQDNETAIRLMGKLHNIGIDI